MSKDAQRMMALFAGFEQAHGTHGVPTPKEGTLKWEIKTTAKTLREPVTLKLWEQHLAGKRPLGIMAIREDSKCRWGSIDYDVYDADLLALIDRVERNNLPLVPCRSKSGGLHLFLFMSEWIPAEKMQSVLKEMSSFLGVAGSEIFPKQAQILLDRGDLPNWIVMPYFGSTYGGKIQEQVGLKKTGAEMSLTEFLRVAENSSIDEKKLNTFVRKASRAVTKRSAPSPRTGSRGGEPFSDGPPCLQTLAEEKVQRGHQNKTLFHMGVYYKKAFPDDWQQKLEEAGRVYLDPPSSAEGMVSVIRSLDKKEYNYLCKEEPMVSHCNVSLCRSRRFGIGVEGEYPELRELSKLVTDPPVWFVTVGEKNVRVELTTKELQVYSMFQHACMERAECCFLQMKQSDWIEVVHEAMQNVVPLPAPPEAGEYGRFVELVEEFCTNRQKGLNKEDILNGNPWLNQEDGRHYFRIRDLHRHLVREGMKEMTRTRLASRLRDMGGSFTSIDVGERSVRVWWVEDSKLEAAPELPVPREDDVDI